MSPVSDEMRKWQWREHGLYEHLEHAIAWDLREHLRIGTSRGLISTVHEMRKIVQDRLEEF